MRCYDRRELNNWLLSRDINRLKEAAEHSAACLRCHFDPFGSAVSEEEFKILLDAGFKAGRKGTGYAEICDVFQRYPITMYPSIVKLLLANGASPSQMHRTAFHSIRPLDMLLNMYEFDWGTFAALMLAGAKMESHTLSNRPVREADIHGKIQSKLNLIRDRYWTQINAAKTLLLVWHRKVIPYSPPKDIMRIICEYVTLRRNLDLEKPEQG